MCRARDKKVQWGIWYLLSNQPLRARQAAKEYSFRFGCEGGFRDVNKSGRLSIREQPSRDIPTADVDDNVQLVVGSLGWRLELGNVPAPELVGRRGHQLRFGIIGMSELVTSFTHRLSLLENAIHCPLRAEVLLLIEQGRIDSTRCLIDEPGTIKRLCGES